VSESGDLRRALKCAATVFCICVIFLDFFSELSAPRFLFLARAILERGSIDISPDIVDSAATRDIALRDGCYYAGTYPGTTLLMLPAAAVGFATWDMLPPQARAWFNDAMYDWIVVLTIALGSAPLAALGAFLFSVALARAGVTDRANTLWTLGLVLGTPIGYYSARLADSAPTFAVTALLVGIMAPRAESRGRGSWLVTGLALGFLDLINPLAMVVSLIAITVRALPELDRSKVAVAAIGALPAEILLRSYLASAFGSPFASPYAFTVDECLGGVWARLGWMGGMVAVRRDFWDVLWGTTFGIRGLFVFVPITIAAILASCRGALDLPGDARRAARAGLAAWLFNHAVLFLFLHGLWTGGTSWGPRYLNAALPWLIFGAAVSGRAVGVSFLATLSIFLTWLGLQIGPSETPFANFYYFLLSGPTTPLTRYATRMSELRWIPDRIAAGVEASWSGQYVAFTHISATASYLILILVLYAIWRPMRRSD
jgi:hypothetical protein